MVIGFGNIRRFIIPALMALTKKYGSSVQILISDTKSLDQILIEEPKLTKQQTQWLKRRYVEKGSLKSSDRQDITSHTRICYLALPPDQYETVIKKNLSNADIFVIEKPWALTPSAFKDLLQLFATFPKKKLLAADHYIWRTDILKFCEELNTSKNRKILDAINSYDLVLCEQELDPINRKFFWRTGIVIDMIPHVLVLLEKILGPFRVHVSNVYPSICDSKVVRNVIGIGKEIHTDLEIKETCAELLLRIHKNHSEKEIHVIICKGAKLNPVKLYRNRKTSLKFFCGKNGKLLLDISNSRFFIQDFARKFHPGKTVSPEYYAMFYALVTGNFDNFVRLSSVAKFIKLYQEITVAIHNTIYGKDHAGFSVTDYGIRLLSNPRYNYRQNSNLKCHLIHKDCCLESRLN